MTRTSGRPARYSIARKYRPCSRPKSKTSRTLACWICAMVDAFGAGWGAGPSRDVDAFGGDPFGAGPSRDFSTGTSRDADRAGSLPPCAGSEPDLRGLAPPEAALRGEGESEPGRRAGGESG